MVWHFCKWGLRQKFLEIKLKSSGRNGELGAYPSIELVLEVGNGADWLYGKLGNINFIPSLGLPKGEGNSTSLETLTNYGKFRLLLSL